MQARADVSETPRVIAGRYELHDVLGRGGMGVVWRGQDRLLHRTVAVKEVVPPATLFGDDRDAVKTRVLREARAAARLGHHGVVTVFDLVEAEDRIFIVMELVQGPSLEELVTREGPLSPAVAADVGLQMLEVLEVAHADGIVHRDVKPGNVLIVQGGRVKLGDFGIASISGDPRITATGMVLGSPSYMAPEQARGETVGPATDLWGLGASLYFAVEGHAPFRKDQPIPTLAAVIQEDPHPLERADGLKRVILDLLAKEPDARPSGRVLREMLAEIKAKAAAGEETTQQLAKIAASHPKTPTVPSVDHTLAVSMSQPEPQPVVPETPPVEPGPSPVEPEPAPVEPEPEPFEPEPEPVEPELSAQTAESQGVETPEPAEPTG
ncbi:MAG TPA: serine/threonine-protein kinase, partial [Actinomycetota bacterium]|nr:serine/threonine-protein kinase [Actinomycetota bacterium]